MAEGVGSRSPKYHRIADDLRAQVQSGALAPGDRLPAETAIAQKHGTSVPTVRQAMAVLRAEGLIESRHGIGTFVRQNQRLQRRSRNRYGEARGRTGLLNNKFRHDIVFAGVGDVPRYITDAMGLEAGATAVVRRRHLYDEDGALQEIGASYLPRSFAEDTYLAEPTVVPKALFRCVEDITGRRYTHAQDQWTARPATPDEADAFDLTLGSYVMHVVHVARDAEGDILEVSESIWPADRLSFVDEYEIPQEAIEESVRSDV
ncbi:GntR family transcriptional regulator [Oryzihumus leptocrescens]|uniref:GntR family transcriptional regulator n=1 Tax=Oryzihumus leptocrescens TaxID=297536 RepID=A0A542ZF23_9MICO|nr:GntR family transcriptional regulator [Oryzihumus leptocrescens]TQL58917.1 GntR family transcriptional regulator [Oryzihumus leptocrescens]